MHVNSRYINNIFPLCLTHFQTTNLRPFQTERVCRWQFQIWLKWQKVLEKGRKTLWEKEKLLVTSNFSISHSVFERLLLQTRKNPGLFGEGSNVLFPHWICCPNSYTLMLLPFVFYMSSNIVVLYILHAHLKAQMYDNLLKRSSFNLNLWMIYTRSATFWKLTQHVRHSPNWKHFADDKMIAAQTLEFIFEKVDYTVAKGENPGNNAMDFSFLFSKMFSKAIGQVTV